MKGVRRDRPSTLLMRIFERAAEGGRNTRRRLREKNDFEKVDLTIFRISTSQQKSPVRCEILHAVQFLQKLLYTASF